MAKEYALYKGDDLLGIGTMRELAVMRDVTLNSIRYLKLPCYKTKQEKRGNPWNTLALIDLEEAVLG